MIGHTVRSYPSSAKLPRAEQLAWKLAAVATDPVAAAALDRHPVRAAREQALRRPASPGAAVFGAAPQVRAAPEWAAWANGVAVRDLDFNDTFLAAEYSHPGDNIPPLLAVAQH